MKQMTTVLAMVVAFLLFAAPAAHPQGALHAECVAGEVQVTAGYFNNGVGEEIVGLVVTRDWVGACDTPLVITPEPYPLPAVYEATEFAFAHTPPEMDKYFGYVLWLTDGDGNLVSPGPQGDVLHYDFAACAPAVAARGYLIFDGFFWIEPCPDTCWHELCNWGPLDMSGLDPEAYDPYLNAGIPVDLYGEAFVDGMPGGPCLIVSDLQPTAGGDCGPVPATATSWSTIKRRYR